MTDNELLLAISDLLDKKLTSELHPIRNELKQHDEKLDFLIEKSQQHDEKMLQHDEKLDSLIEKSQQHDEKMLQHDEKLDFLIEKSQQHDEKMLQHDEKLDFLIEKSQQHDIEFSKLSQDNSGINLHLENVTDKNLSILAENYLNLVEKLNQTIKATDKNLLYEIKVNYLTEKVELLEKEIADLKSKIA